MTNQEWKNLIAKEFGVSNTVAKGMLHAMYKAKEYLEIPKNVHREEAKKRAEQEEKERKDLEYYAWADFCDDEFMTSMTRSNYL